MSDQKNGLRFDVYERVHLPDDVAAIEELEEIELVPRIQVIEQGDQAILKGQLLLNGVYRGHDAEDSPLVLEHWIPVEISLPMNRVSQLEDISIEIDNFDVDLLSARTLNITGVLSLRGIITEPIEEEQETWDAETFIAIHEREFIEAEVVEEEEREEYDQSFVQSPYITVESVDSDNWSVPSSEFDAGVQAEAAPEFQFQREEEESEPEASFTSAHAQTMAEAYEESPPAFSEEREPQFEAQFEPSYEQQDNHQDEPQPFAEQPYVQQRDQDHAQQFAQDFDPSSAQLVAEPFSEPFEPPAVQQQRAQESAPAQQPVQQQEPQFEQQQESFAQRQPEQERSKQPLNVNVSSNQSGADAEQASQVGLMTILESSKREQAVREAAVQSAAKQEASEPARTQGAEDEIEWKNLFLSKKADEREFSKIRVCIVQKEETLEQIAMRYSLNPRDLLIHNRLHESAISEGQVLYIP